MSFTLNSVARFEYLYDKGIDYAFKNRLLIFQSSLLFLKKKFNNCLVMIQRIFFHTFLQYILKRQMAVRFQIFGAAKLLQTDARFKYTSLDYIS